LRYGEEVLLNHKILTTDTFSHTFTGDCVLDYEWLIEGIYYLLFVKFSFLGIIFTFGFLSSFIYLLPAVISKGNLFVKFIIIFWSILGTINILKIGARPQNISLLFFSIVYILLLKYFETFKIKYLILLPFIFLVWANAHPAYYLGIFLTLFFILIESLLTFIQTVKREISRQGIIKNIRVIILLSIFLVISVYISNFKPKIDNTGGFSLDFVKANILPSPLASEYSESGKVRVTIAEWLPPVYFDVSGTFFILGILYSIGMFTAIPYSKKYVRSIMLLLIFIYFSTLARRNTPYFFLIFIPIAIEYTSYILKSNKLYRYTNVLNLISIVMIVWITLSNLPKKTIDLVNKSASFTSFCEAKKYPCKAVEFVKKAKLSGNMYNFYNWGGYLVWDLREYPTFIDGRMPWGKVFDEYQEVMDLQGNWREILNKYNVNFMILPRSKFLEEIVKMDNKWEEAYSDDIAVVLVREKQQ